MPVLALFLVLAGVVFSKLYSGYEIHDDVRYGEGERNVLDIYGSWHPVSNKNEKLSRLVVYPKSLCTLDGCPEITLTIRYPYGFTFESVVEALASFAASFGYDVSYAENTACAYLLDKDSDTLRLLTEISNSVCCDKKEPYVMTGGTYAHVLPNAYVFGTDSNCPPEDFPKGHGGVRGVDEAVSVDRLIRMMKIYALALLALEKIL